MSVNHRICAFRSLGFRGGMLPPFWYLYPGGWRQEGFYVYLSPALYIKCCWVLAHGWFLDGFPHSRSMTSCFGHQSLMNLCVPGTGLGPENIMKVPWLGLLGPTKDQKGKESMTSICWIAFWTAILATDDKSPSTVRDIPDIYLLVGGGVSGTASRMERYASWAWCRNWI